MSLLKDGKNAFADPSDPLGLSKVAYGFIAGLMEHVRGMSAITNPLVNSYKRLLPGYEAPVYIAWATRNRSPLIRIPAARGQATRVELRNPDPACNPYLALAAMLAAGLDGVRRGLVPPPSVERNIFEMTPAERAAEGIGTLPGSLSEAVDELLADKLVVETLGAGLVAKYAQAKREEWDAYRMFVHPWEIDTYLARY
jgi:glutamine synthetase